MVSNLDYDWDQIPRHVLLRVDLSLLFLLPWLRTRSMCEENGVGDVQKKLSLVCRTVLSIFVVIGTAVVLVVFLHSLGQQRME
jgi:uncharacterized membrane protein YhdT